MPSVRSTTTWLPTRFTQSLSGTEVFVTDGDRLIELVEKYWRTPDGLLVLDDWQRFLLRHALERYPDDWHDERLAGRLRFRQILVSLGRQNGKSVLGAIFGLYGLLQHSPGASVVGLATSVEQAQIIYSRVEYTVNNNPALLKILKATGTRGIRHRNGTGAYLVKASKYEALQGVPITVGLVDELHLLAEAIWDSVVNGQRAQKDAVLLGITTAGDETSTLLKRLYKQADEAIAGDADRFGAFIWEAPEGATIEDRDAICAANPAIACGRIDIETVQSDVRSLPEPDQIRYTLNRFVASSSSWLPMTHWHRAIGDGVTTAKGLVFAFDRSPSWEYGSVAVATKTEDGLQTQLVAMLTKPSPEQFERIAMRLKKQHGADVTFVMDSYALGKVATALKDRGYRVEAMKQNDVIQACSLAYANLARGRVKHANDDLLKHQVPRAQRKNVGEHWRIVGKEIDGLMATVLAMYVADTQKVKPVMQLFTGNDHRANWPLPLSNDHKSFRPLPLR